MNKHNNPEIYHKKAYNIDYPIESFAFFEDPFYVVIGDNKFSLTDINLNIESKDLRVKGNIKLMNLTRIKNSLLNPNIMGFFSYIPFMECNHGVISMGHQLSGILKVNGEEIDFTGGKGYIEKDWGKSFPSSYVWLQSNHFPDASTGLFCSVAKIPFLLFSFNGYICNLVHQGEEYRFATYNGSKLLMDDRAENGVMLKFKNKEYSLEIKGVSLLSKKLLAPKVGSMDKMIKEGLSGKIEVLLRDKDGNVVLDSKSDQCGMEIVEELLPVNAEK